MFDIELAKKAQARYCDETKCPHFAPRDGICYRCGHQIYSPTKAQYGYTIGISVEAAANSLITSCPYCNASYCD